MKSLVLTSIVFKIILIVLFATNAYALNHPGVFSSQADLDFMKDAINNDPNHPMRAGYDAMLTTTAAGTDKLLSSLGYAPTPKAHQKSSDLRNIESDAQAAYVHALMWVVTGNQAHADKSIEIMNGWAQTFVDYTDDTFAGDRMLQSGWLIPIWAGAAEIIRHYNDGAAGWSSADIGQFERFLGELYATAISASENCRGWNINGCQYIDSPEFDQTSVFVHGGESFGQKVSHERLSVVLAMTTYGVFTDNETIYNTGKEYYRWLLPRCIYPDGQNVELCRGQERVAMAMVTLQQIPEVAWHQGDDLYGITIGDQTSPRLLVGMQWRAKQAYGLITTGICNGVTETFNYDVSHLPGWECAYNHYQNRMGIDVNDINDVNDVVDVNEIVETYVTVDHRPLDYSPDFLSFNCATHSELGSNDRFETVLLYSDDFNESLANWTVEKENPSTSIALVEGKLDINTISGSTVWFNQKLSRNIKIEYDVTTLGDGVQSLPRDHNLFWMAHNLSNPDVQPSGTGSFSTYDCFDLYYFGIGANQNTTTRFRRYNNCNRTLILEYRDAEYMNVAGQTYHITIICQGSHIQVYRDGQIYWDFTDPEPYTEGWFGFRQTQTHLQMDNFRVFDLSVLVSGGDSSVDSSGDSE